MYADGLCACTACVCADAAAWQVLSLVDENFAAGVRYAIDNSYNETTNVLIYNMGNAHTQVWLDCLLLCQQ